MKKQFPLKRAYAYRLIKAFLVAEQLGLVHKNGSPIGDTKCYDSLLRPLTKLDEKEREGVFQEAFKIADGKPLQAKHVQQAIANTLDPEET